MKMDRTIARCSPNPRIHPTSHLSSHTPLTSPVARPRLRDPCPRQRGLGPHLTPAEIKPQQLILSAAMWPSWTRVATSSSRSALITVPPSPPPSCLLLLTNYSRRMANALPHCLARLFGTRTPAIGATGRDLEDYQEHEADR